MTGDVCVWCGQPGRAARAARRSPQPPALAKRVRKLLLLGLSMGEVAEVLTQAGVEGARGGRWHRSSVQRLLEAAERDRAHCLIHHDVKEAP